MNWQLILGLVGEIYARVLVEYPNAKMSIETTQLFVRVRFTVSTSQLDRGGVTFTKDFAFDVDEVLYMRCFRPWAVYQANKIIEQLKECISEFSFSQKLEHESPNSINSL